MGVTGRSTLLHVDAYYGMAIYIELAQDKCCALFTATATILLILGVRQCVLAQRCSGVVSFTSPETSEKCRMAA